jgi:hypothetical protein
MGPTATRHVLYTVTVMSSAKSLYHQDTLNPWNRVLEKFIPCTISGFHDGEYDDGCLLGCSAMRTAMSLPTFQRPLLSLSSGFHHYRPHYGGSKDFLHDVKHIPVLQRATTQKTAIFKLIPFKKASVYCYTTNSRTSAKKYNKFQIL